MTKGTDCSGMKVWVTPPRKEARPTEVLGGIGGSSDWIIEKGRYKYPLRPCGQLLN